MKVFVLTFLIVASRHLLMSAWFNCAEDFHQDVELESNKLGAIDMFFLLSYAIGNFILGILGDSYRQKKVLWLSSSIACVIYALVLKT
jgi:sugar phosphate permease